MQAQECTVRRVHSQHSLFERRIVVALGNPNHLFPSKVERRCSRTELSRSHSFLPLGRKPCRRTIGPQLFATPLFFAFTKYVAS